jgi:hypothetical protein
MDKPMEIVDPPESRPGRGPSDKWLNIAATLKNDYPGQFGLVGRYSNGVGGLIRKGSYPAFLPPGFTKDPGARADYMAYNWVVTSRKGDIYIKWVGVDEA